VKIVLATTNQGKVRELARLLGDGVELIALSDVTTSSYEVEETGTTFEENATLKALAAVAVSGLPALAEDSGLEVDALRGAPGIHSARFAGPDATDAANNELVLKRLEGVASAERGARFVSVLVLAAPTARGPAKVSAARGTLEGRIVLEPRGEGGFGYDPLFEPVATPGRTTGEMTLDEKNALSHRGAAARALTPKLNHWLLERQASSAVLL
jgi:XTP/dITP diphosphohydrolase